MRFLFWFLLLAVAAVVAALAARLNAGYALLVAPPYRVELSLNLLLILIVGGFAALYFGLRVIVRTIQLPAQVREWRRLQKKDRARAKPVQSLQTLLKELRATDMSTELPGLAGSLDAVRVLQLAREKRMR